MRNVVPRKKIVRANFVLQKCHPNCFNRREIRRSLAIFDRKVSAHPGSQNSRDFGGGTVGPARPVAPRVAAVKRTLFGAMWDFS